MEDSVQGRLGIAAPQCKRPIFSHSLVRLRGRRADDPAALVADNRAILATRPGARSETI
jgi:hypothetical protein